MRLLFSFLILTLLISCNCKHHLIYENDDQFFLSIHQRLVEPEIIFVMRQGEFNVIEVKSKKKGVRYKNVYSSHLTSIQSNTLKELSQQLHELNESYEKPVLGGVDWLITIYDGKIEKQVRLLNAQTIETEILFKEINRILPISVPQLLLK